MHQSVPVHTTGVIYVHACAYMANILIEGIMNIGRAGNNIIMLIYNSSRFWYVESYPIVLLRICSTGTGLELKRLNRSVRAAETTRASQLVNASTHSAYVCIYIYIYTHIYIYIYTHTYTHTHAHVRTRTHTYAHVHTHTYTHVHTCTRTGTGTYEFGG